MKGRRSELYNKLIHLGIIFGLLVGAYAVSKSWMGIAKASGIIPTGPTVDPEATNATTALHSFVSGILSWIAGIAGLILGGGFAAVAIMHWREDDPNRRG